MPYNTDQSGSTLTDSERAQEAARILNRISGRDLRNCGLTDSAITFIAEKQSQLQMFGEVAVTLKQLWWLRDIGEKVD